MKGMLILRKLSGLSQFTLARKSGVPRVRISLAETGQLELAPDERERISVVLLMAIEARQAELAAARSRMQENAQFCKTPLSRATAIGKFKTGRNVQ